MCDISMFAIFLYAATMYDCHMRYNHIYIGRALKDFIFADCRYASHITYNHIFTAIIIDK